MKIIFFNYSALAILLLILLSAVFRKVGSSNGNRFFILLIFEVLLTTIFDIGAVGLDNLGAGNIAAKYVCHSGYLITHTMTALFYLFYLIALTDTWHKLKKHIGILIAILLPIIVYLAFQVGTYLGVLQVFYISDAGVYTRGTHFFMGYVVGAYYLLVGMAYIVRFRKLFNLKWVLTLFAPYPFIAGAMLLEFFYPYLVIELFFNSLAFLFIYVNIQRPDESVDPISGLSQTPLYEQYCRRAYMNEKPITIIMVDIINAQYISDLFDVDGRYAFKRQMASEFQDVNKMLKLKAMIFTGYNNGFFLCVNRKMQPKVNAACQMIVDKLTVQRSVAGIDVKPEVSICVVNAPEDIPDFSDFIRFGNSNFDDLSEERIVYAGNLFATSGQRMKLRINKIIEEALDNYRLEVYYQPIYSIAKKRFVSAEALIRLKDPEYGFVPPDLFIPAAEQSGSINRIWDFVLNSVCSFITTDKFKESGIDYIEVNLSAVQCMNENLASEIVQVVDSYGIKRQRIGIEITETAVINDHEHLKKNLDALSDAGMLICLDDFGTGYSDVRRILDLPMNIVKMDKDFFKGIHNHGIKMIVGGFIRTLNDVGYLIVAEGVETLEVLNILEEFGCDYVQGFYFSRPVPKNEFVRLCKEFNNRDISKDGMNS